MRGAGIWARFLGVFGIAFVSAVTVGSAASAQTLPTPTVPSLPVPSGTPPLPVQPPPAPALPAPIPAPPPVQLPAPPPAPIQLPAPPPAPIQLPSQPPPAPIQLPPLPVEVPPPGSPPVALPALPPSLSAAAVPAVGSSQDPASPELLGASQQQTGSSGAAAPEGSVRTELPQASDGPGVQCLAATSAGLAASRACGATLVKPGVLTGSVGARNESGGFEVAGIQVGDQLAGTGFRALSVAVIGAALVAAGVALTRTRRRARYRGTMRAGSAGG
jgi:hypothetical protein